MLVPAAVIVTALVPAAPPPSFMKKNLPAETVFATGKVNPTVVVPVPAAFIKELLELAGMV